MIIPSIDLMGGQAVQLVGGREKKIEAGDPIPIAEQFRIAGEIAVVDLDAALNQGDNAGTIKRLLDTARCRVGGGIRDVATALRWLDAGAAKVVLGTAAVPEVLGRLPTDRVIAALDAQHGEVVVQGWRKPTGRQVVDCMRELRRYVGGFLVTFVEREGRMQGLPKDRVGELLEAADGVPLTVAGGLANAEEIAEIDALGADVQVGMALYSGALDLGTAIMSPMRSDRADGLWPTVVCDEQGVALGLAWSDKASIREAVRTRRGVYHSRSRGRWVKGDTSGDTQELLRVDLDCDRDALRFTVAQRGTGFCHRRQRTCWGPAWGVGELARRVAATPTATQPTAMQSGSYTRRLLDDAALLDSKLVEEAQELAQERSAVGVVGEAADLLYFTLVALARAGVDLCAVEAELDRRALKVIRRPGDAKGQTHG